MFRWLPDKIMPRDVPKNAVGTLLLGCLLLGLAGMRAGGMAGVCQTLENWLMMLLILPSAITVVALPLKLRDRTFDLKMVYYMGIFVAFLFVLGKLRYLR